MLSPSAPSSAPAAQLEQHSSAQIQLGLSIKCSPATNSVSVTFHLLFRATCTLPPLPELFSSPLNSVRQAREVGYFFQSSTLGRGQRAQKRPARRLSAESISGPERGGGGGEATLPVIQFVPAVCSNLFPPRGRTFLSALSVFAAALWRATCSGKRRQLWRLSFN